LWELLYSGKLGPKRKSEIKNKNFECGVEGIGNARIPFSVKFWLLFCLYYLMSKLFLYPWAINFKELGMEGMVKMVIFMVPFGGFFLSSKESARMGIRNYYKH
jgi:NADH-quinone oxidoreductase subunit A